MLTAAAAAAAGSTGVWPLPTFRRTQVLLTLRPMRVPARSGCAGGAPPFGGGLRPSLGRRQASRCMHRPRPCPPACTAQSRARTDGHPCFGHQHLNALKAAELGGVAAGQLADQGRCPRPGRNCGGHHNHAALAAANSHGAVLGERHWPSIVGDTDRESDWTHWRSGAGTSQHALRLHRAPPDSLPAEGSSRELLPNFPLAATRVHRLGTERGRIQRSGLVG
jgi:hypothetical protein